jgi:isopropylmalate/homocitrate/citramalate synthase
MPGVIFNKEEKIELARKMSDFGIGIIELMPAISRTEREVTEYLTDCGLGSQVTATTMLRKEHIDLAKYCRVNRISLFSSISDIHLDKKLKISRKENLEKSLEYVLYAREKGLIVDFAGEDSTRADFNYLIDFINSLDGKIEYFLACDTLGILTPRQTYGFIKRLKQETNCKIGVHVHNDFGCATANTLAGIEAGADMFSGTFNGIGERAGNTAIEEVIVALKYQYGMDLGLKYELLGELCSLVEKYSGATLQAHKPVSGENAFSHESGIHVDGVIKHSKNYENFSPADVGRTRRILFGKHSGTNSLRYLFGNRFSDDQYGKILQEIKSKSEEEKRAFSEQEVLNMFME